MHSPDPVELHPSKFSLRAASKGDWQIHIQTYINMVADEMHRFSTSHRMKLNSAKCKKMIINFMAYPKFSVTPICIGDSVVECVKSYKLLQVYKDNDLKWNSHIDYVVKKNIKETLRALLYDISFCNETS